MSIRLSGAQVTRVRECLQRYKDNVRYGGRWTGRDVPVQTATEELCEDILKIVLPSVQEVHTCASKS